MPKTKEHLTKKWEISLAEFENTAGKLFKVTRRLPKMAVAETKVFRSREQAMQLFNEWLSS